MSRPRKKSTMCAADNVCPAEERKPIGSWCHPFEKTYDGALYDTMTCPHCGFEVKAAKPR